MTKKQKRAVGDKMRAYWAQRRAEKNRELKQSSSIGPYCTWCGSKIQVEAK